MSKGIKGGSVIFTFDGDTKNIEKKSSKLASKLSGALKGATKGLMVGATVAGGALTGLVTKAVTSAGELEQQVGGAEAVFKDLGETIDKINFKSIKDEKGNVISLAQASKGAYKTMGLSANSYMATLNKMGALMKGSGLKTQTALDLSAKAMQQAADVASIMGIDVGFAMESVAGAAKGNFTMMDNLGVAMNATTIEAYALSKGIKKSWKDMENAQKVQLAMEMFLEKTSYATGNYAKENKTFAGSLTTVKAAIQNLLSGAGDIEGVISSVVNFADIVVTKVGEAAPRIIEGVMGLINGLLPKIPELIKNLLPSIIDGVISVVNGIVKTLPNILTMLSEMLPDITQSAVDGFIDVVNALINSLPTLVSQLGSMLPTILQALVDGLISIVNMLAELIPSLIPVVVQAILGIVPVLLQNLPLFIDAGLNFIFALMEGLFSAIPVIIDMLPQIIDSLIQGLIGSLPQLLSVGIRFMLELGAGLVKAIPSLVAAIPTILVSLVTGFAKGVGSFIDVGKKLLDGLWNGMKRKFDWLKGKIKGLGKAILGTIKGLFGIKSPSTEFEFIGKMNMAGLEKGMRKGREKIKGSYDSIFIDGINDLSPNMYNNSSLNMSPVVNVTVNANFEQDPLGQIVREIKTFGGGSKNDYNYGMGVTR